MAVFVSRNESSDRLLAVAARVSHRDAPQTRGIFIESGAFDVRNVEGRFIATEAQASGAEVTTGARSR